MKLIIYEVRDRIGYITLNRPEKRNALNPQLVNELKETFSLAESDHKVKVIVLKANGQAFCAGADLAYLKILQSNTFQENLADSNHLASLFYQLYTLKKVIVAQVHGHAIAGGAGLAAVCDFVFAVPEAMFGYTEVKIGFLPALVSIFLLRKVGETKAKELLLTGELINALQAQNIGLINDVFPANKLEERVNEFALNLCKKTSATSLELTKKLISQVQTMELEESLKLAAQYNAEARDTIDCKKGIAAFLNKEQITW